MGSLYFLELLGFLYVIVVVKVVTIAIARIVNQTFDFIADFAEKSGIFCVLLLVASALARL